MYLRPTELNDQVIDFGSFAQNYFTVSTGLNPSDHAIQYYIARNGQTISNPPTIINQNGTNGAGYSVQKLDNNPMGYIFKRPLNGPGYYSDLINYFNKIVSYSQSDPKFNLPRPYLTQGNEFGYFIFQKAVASVKVDGNAITSGKLVNATSNTPIEIDGSNSRGYDQSYNMNIYLRDETLNWVHAVDEVDFSSVKNDANNSYNITFLKVKEFKIVIKVIGFDSYNNNFGHNSQERDLITDNSDTIVFKVNTGIQANIDNITLPKIYPVIQAEKNQDDSYSLIFANKTFIINYNIDYTSASWVVNSTHIYPTNSLWLDELQNNCNIRLHVTDVNNLDIMPPKIGLGPHKILIPSIANYKFKYVTTLK